MTCQAQDAPKGTKLEFEQSGKLKGQSVVAAQKGTTVTVENLFHNLPVRKRELERNIKREWGRVVTVLGQYACIQTGIKFSVTQQAGKGKKTTLFSTKGNPTTRENLVNVFGAKTLAALVAMDLNLELEPTSGPSQRWSTQDDGGTKEIRIVGHISRPAFGEGRQTPDKQMFFVNARPCGLPQVAKAFNEVYKTYNSSQSPFIFANIELDTHMYDVNVSPDKRTILLHDQTRMLENLKTALVELFESQDYTVPIAQLPAQKQPAYKQLTLSRESSSISTVSSRQSPFRRTERGGDEEVEAEPTGEQDEDSEDEGETESPGVVKGSKAVSRDSLAKATSAVSLISKWTDNQAGNRSNTKSDRQLPHAEANGVSKEKLLLAEKFIRENGQPQMAEVDAAVLDSSSASNGLSQEQSSFRVPLPVADFNARLAEFQKGPQKATKVLVGEDEEEAVEEDEEGVEQDEGEGEAEESEEWQQEDEEDEEEAPIPSLQTPAKHPPSIADKFSAAPRLQRQPLEMATITIAGETTISPVGSPAKRLRMIGPPSSQIGINTPVKKGSAPSFGSRLSQKFAAPGTAADVEDVQDEDDPEEEDDDEETIESDEGTNKDDRNNSSFEIATLKQPGVEDVSHSEAPEAHEHYDCDCSQGDPLPSRRGPNSVVEEEVVDEDEQKREEAARVENAIKTAELSAQMESEENLQRAKSLLKGSKKKDSTIDLVRTVNISAFDIEAHVNALTESLSRYDSSSATEAPEDEGLDSLNAEEKLSLTITKSDFPKMRIVGQFNLGFILATRASQQQNNSEGNISGDDLFIIDQHASDEKYNFERLSSTTILQSQPLVTPKTLDLTAMEEELVLEHKEALTKNGFITSFDDSGASPVGSRCKLLALPLSQSTTFNLSDLDELLALLAEIPQGSSIVPRPSKVRKMFAMRACRSSIMIGRTLTRGMMGKVVGRLGELDKPWNCPHGRPTMRHLCGLGVWDGEGWRGDVEEDRNDDGGRSVDWAAWVRERKDEMEEVDEDEEEEDNTGSYEGGEETKGLAADSEESGEEPAASDEDMEDDD